jgi:hypothetical protein
MQPYSLEWWIVEAAFPFLLCYFLASLPAFAMIVMEVLRER